MQHLKNIGIGLLIFAGFSFFIGTLSMLVEYDPLITGQDQKCEYRTYASRYNPFYRAGCELFEKRY